jgi:hydroxymethylglutaryl-CoA synthase
VDGLWWGTATPPFAEGPSFAYLAAALDLDETIDGALLAGSPLAGMEAVLAAWDAVAAGRVDRALVVAADAPIPGLGTAYEREAGAGGAAFVLAAGPDGPAVLGRRASATHPHLDRYRGVGEAGVRDVYDGRLFREEIFLPATTAVARRLADGLEPATWALPDPDGRLGRRLAKDLGVDTIASDGIRRDLGDTGAAAGPFGLAACLTGSGTGVAMAHGAGRTVGCTVEVTRPVPGADTLASLADHLADTPYAAVLRARRQLVADTDPIEMAIPPGSAQFVRGNVELLALHGAKCRVCGVISTPPSVHPTCIGCGGSDLDEVPLARAGAIHTYVVNATMPAPFEAPLPMLVLDLDDGARLLVQGVGPADDVVIGGRVELVLRRYAIERGAPVYGFKAAPATGVSGPGEEVGR